jgi:hypothetical protein
MRALRELPRPACAHSRRGKFRTKSGRLCLGPRPPARRCTSFAVHNAKVDLGGPLSRALHSPGAELPVTDLHSVAVRGGGMRVLQEKADHFPRGIWPARVCRIPPDCHRTKRDQRRGSSIARSPPARSHLRVFTSVIVSAVAVLDPGVERRRSHLCHDGIAAGADRRVAIAMENDCRYCS